MREGKGGTNIDIPAKYWDVILIESSMSRVVDRYVMSTAIYFIFYNYDFHYRKTCSQLKSFKM